MFTTWYNDYSQLQAFATAAKSNWGNYLASITSNVTASVSVSSTVVTYNRVTLKYSSVVKLTNNGPALTSAAFVADGLPAGVSMTAPDGTTSAALPAGSPYKEFGPIGAGQSVSLTIQWSRTATQPISWTSRVLGAGAR